VPRPEPVLSSLHLGSSASSAGISNPSGVVPVPGNQEGSRLKRGALLPQPLGIFCLGPDGKESACQRWCLAHTSEELTQRIEQSRKGTRAPVQGRTGGGANHRLRQPRCYRRSAPILCPTDRVHLTLQARLTRRMNGFWALAENRQDRRHPAPSQPNQAALLRQRLIQGAAPDPKLFRSPQAVSCDCNPLR
jgi:hypothetical protein